MATRNLARIRSILTAIALAAAVAPLALFTAGCGGNKSTKIIVAPGYKKQFAINAELAVVILDKYPQIIYLGDLKKSLESTGDRNTDGEILAWNFFTGQLKKDIMQEIDVKDVFKAEVRQNYRVTKDFFRTSDEDITIELPADGTEFKFDSTQAALVLFIDKIRIGTETDPYFQERAQHGLYLSNARRLVYLATFILWDNREHKPICYGRVKTITTIVREEATVANWEEVSRDFVRAIFEPTGFKKRADKTTGVELVR